MCDIIVATPAATATGTTIFGKNSDRDPNEAQVHEIVEPRSHTGPVETTYTTVAPELLPDRDRTNRTLVSRPWWIWGAEMGANEHGLVAGNVAVFTREPYREGGLLGMDCLRLALEWTDEPRAAVELVGRLIEAVGQGGPNSYSRPFDYHNAFVFADATEAWLLESAGNVWVARQIEGVHTLSNRLTITDEWDLASTIDPREHAAEQGWHEPGTAFDFAASYTDPSLQNRFSGAKQRRSCTAAISTEPIDRDTVMARLRTHDHEPYDPAAGSMRDVCMHYGGTTRPSHTAASLVSVLDTESPTHWITGASHPCLCPFKPVTLEGGLPDLGPEPTNRFDHRSYWWRLERLHRTLEAAATADREAYRSAVTDLEDRITTEHADGSATDTARAFEREAALHERWQDVEPVPQSAGWAWRRRQVNEQAGLSLPVSGSVTATARTWLEKSDFMTGK